MSKVNENTNKTKILVDHYQLLGDRLACDCLIAEPFQTFEREVTYEEIYNHVVINGRVVMDNGTQITFVEYLSELGIQDTCNLCAEIINKREKRNEISEMPDIFSTLGAILNPSALNKVA